MVTEVLGQIANSHYISTKPSYKPQRTSNGLPSCKAAITPQIKTTSACGMKSTSGKRPPTHRKIVLEFNRQRPGWMEHRSARYVWPLISWTWSPMVPHLCCLIPEPELAGYTCLALAKFTLKTGKEDRWRPRPSLTPPLLTQASFSSNPLDRLLFFKFSTCHTHMLNSARGVCKHPDYCYSLLVPDRPVTFIQESKGLRPRLGDRTPLTTTGFLYSFVDVINSFWITIATPGYQHQLTLSLATTSNDTRIVTCQLKPSACTYKNYFPILAW